MDTVWRMRSPMMDGHVSVRSYRKDDAVALYHAVDESIVDLTRWGFYHLGFTMQDAEVDVVNRMMDWNAGKSFTFLIETLPERAFVGNCRVEEFEPEIHHAALGWWVCSTMTNRGFATAAARLVAQAAFADLHLNSISIYTRVENLASRRVAEKLGAVLSEIRSEAHGMNCAVYTLEPDDLLNDRYG